MTDAVRDAYDARAKEYADLFLDDLDRAPLDREWLGAFAKLVSPGAGAGLVADVGCGPGHIVNHLAELSVQAIGFDRFEVSIRKPKEGERPLDHGTILARRSSGNQESGS